MISVASGGGGGAQCVLFNGSVTELGVVTLPEVCRVLSATGGGGCTISVAPAGGGGVQCSRMSR